MTNLERWDRLASEIQAAGVPVVVSSAAYPGGLTYYVSIRPECGGLIEVRDQWWRKNPDVWIGYQVHAEGPDSIVRTASPITKKRSEVVAAVRAAVAVP